MFSFTRITKDYEMGLYVIRYNALHFEMHALQKPKCRFLKSEINMCDTKYKSEKVNYC